MAWQPEGDTLSVPNGKRKLAIWLGIIASACVCVSSAASYYAGWEKKIDQSVTTQRMVNQHDEALQLALPKIEACHDVNELQEWKINSLLESQKRTDAQVSKMADLIQIYLQSAMRRGEVAR